MGMQTARPAPLPSDPEWGSPVISRMLPGRLSSGDTCTCNDLNMKNTRWVDGGGQRPQPNQAPALVDEDATAGQGRWRQQALQASLTRQPHRCTQEHSVDYHKHPQCAPSHRLALWAQVCMKMPRAIQGVLALTGPHSVPPAAGRCPGQAAML